MLSAVVIVFQTLTVIVNDYSMRVNLKRGVKHLLHNIAADVAEQARRHMPADGAGAGGAVLDPAELIGHYRNLHHGILEVAVFRMADDGEPGAAADREAGDSTAPPGGSGPAGELLYGSYGSFARDTDAADLAAAMREGEAYRSFRSDGRSFLIGSFGFPDSGPYAVRIAADVTSIYQMIGDARNRQILLNAVLLLAAVAINYGIAYMMIRPLRHILGKVDEVASGRFDTPLAVRRRDETGQLAERINAMAKNLDVYTAKLKKAFEENRKMKEYLESIINHTTDAIHIEDVNGVLIRVNPAFEQMFGWSEEEAVGRSLPIVPESHMKEEREAREALLAGQMLPARETVRRRKDGSCFEVSVTTSAIRDRGGVIQAFASITRDMTNRNKMDELLRRSEKLNTVGQLAAGVAHEIRNPLTTLRGFLQLQQQTNKLNQRHIDIMLSELDRINLIVSEFLILAKPQATKFRIQDVRFILGDVISLLDSQAHLCNIVFTTSFDSEPCEVSCEENHLKQVFINILKNAIEAMPKGGEIEIEARKQSDWIVTTIRDHGVGISEEMIPKLGDPFVTSKESGTGLGIMISQRIIQSHQGTMEIRSTVGKGTTVTISLPAARRTDDDGQ
jgi:two-component system, sporulation sensor kinase E